MEQAWNSTLLILKEEISKSEIKNKNKAFVGTGALFLNMEKYLC